VLEGGGFFGGDTGSSVAAIAAAAPTDANAAQPSELARSNIIYFCIKRLEPISPYGQNLIEVPI